MATWTQTIRLPARRRNRETWGTVLLVVLVVLIFLLGQGLVSQPLAHCDTNEQLLNLWLHGKSSSSVEAYRRDISYFLAFVGDKPVWEVTLNDVIGFAWALESKGLQGTQTKWTSRQREFFVACREILIPGLSILSEFFVGPPQRS